MTSANPSGQYYQDCWRWGWGGCLFMDHDKSQQQDQQGSATKCVFFQNYSALSKHGGSLRDQDSPIIAWVIRLSRWSTWYDGIYEIIRNLMKTPGLLRERLMSSWWFTQKKKKSVWCSFVFIPTDRTLSVWRFFFLHPGEDFQRPPVSSFYLMSYQPGRVPRKVMPILFSNLSLILKNFPALKTQIFPSCYCQGEFSFTVSTLAS